VDFGLAGVIKSPTNRFTKCGTPGFLAPELFTCAKNEKYDEKCDVFSTGVVFYIM